MMKPVLIGLFLLYGLLLFRLRYTWRATVYRRRDWKINVLPWFGHDIAALFSNRYFPEADERAMARRYRWYLIGYLALGIAVLAQR